MAIQPRDPWHHFPLRADSSRGTTRLLLFILFVLVSCISFQAAAFFFHRNFLIGTQNSKLSFSTVPSRSSLSANPPQPEPQPRIDDLYASNVSSLAPDLPPGFRVVDADELFRQTAAIDALSGPSARARPTSPLGNLSRLTRLRNQYFETGVRYGGAQLAVALNASSSVTDVRLLLSGGASVPPFASGTPAARASVRSPHDLVINGLDGFVFNERRSVARSHYGFLARDALHAQRHPNLARVPALCRAAAARRPRPWLLEFRNVWMSGAGEILVPAARRRRRGRRGGGGGSGGGGANEWDVVAYQVQGGVCFDNWSYVKARRVRYGGKRRCKTRTRLAFSLAQNHGSSYFHVTHEVVPRLLTFWEVAVAVLSAPGGRIAGPAHPPVVRDMLRMFGVPDKRMALVGYHQPCFFDRVLVPAPVIQDHYQRECLQRTVGHIVGENAAQAHPAPRGPSASAQRPRPLVVLLERARARAGARCRGARCLANFAQLQDALQQEFGERIELQTLTARDPDVMRRGIALFRRATVVVGMHGAGFTNLMFMRGRGTYVVHLGWKKVWQIYGHMAQRFGVDFVNIVTPGAAQDAENAVADIPVVVLQVRRNLAREGFPLDPPRIRTNPIRNAMVTMRMPRNGVEDWGTRFARWNPYT